MARKLERDLATERGVLGEIDDTHAPAAKLLQYAIVGNRLTDHVSASSTRDATFLLPFAFFLLTSNFPCLLQLPQS